MISDGRNAVVVTGSAGAIGSATVTAFVNAGYDVVGLDLSAPPLGATGRHHAVDVRDPEAVSSIVAAETASGAELRHVVSIAGGALPGEPDSRNDPLSLDLELFRRSLESNLTSQFVVLQAMLPWLLASTGDRSVTLTSSFNAFSAQGMPAYSAAKAGLVGLMHALLDPFGRAGIRVNVVAPGTVCTPRTQRLWERSEGHFERLAQGTALGRLGTPADVAEAYLSLARLRHVTGHVLVVDGGQLSVHR